MEIKGLKNKQKEVFFQNLTKAYTEGVYADTPANRKLGRVGMSYKEWTQKQHNKEEGFSITKDSLTEEQFNKILNKLGWDKNEIKGNSFKEKKDNFFEGKTEEEIKEIIDEGLAPTRKEIFDKYKEKKEKESSSRHRYGYKRGKLDWYPIKKVQGIQISGRKNEEGKIVEYSIGDISLENTPENKRIVDAFKKGDIDSFEYTKNNKKYKAFKIEAEGVFGEKYFKMTEKELK